MTPSSMSASMPRKRFSRDVRDNNLSAENISHETLPEDFLPVQLAISRVSDNACSTAHKKRYHI